MRFGAIAGLETAADVASFAVAIALALAGKGYWALVAQRLVSPALLFAGSWMVCRWRPARPAPAEGIRELLRFGGSVTASGLALALARSVDQILIGWLWGPAILGLYERTTRLVLLPVNTINAPVYAAGMPALSRLVDRPERYRSMFRQIMQKLALLTMPVFAITAVLADWLVLILFGPAWVQAIPLVALFSISAAYLPVLMAASLLYMTQGRSGEMLRASLIDAAVCIVAILAGLPWGVTGVAAAIAVAGLLAGDAPRSGIDGQHRDSHRAGSLRRGHGQYRRVGGALRRAGGRGGTDGGWRAVAGSLRFGRHRACRARLAGDPKRDRAAVHDGPVEGAGPVVQLGADDRAALMRRRRASLTAVYPAACGGPYP
jgi:hypothetical protein